MKKSNVLIGIISYLPDSPDIREQRFKKIQLLISNCNYLFKLPIYVVIQNYTEQEQKALTRFGNVILSDNYEKCGILGARRKLREYFINSNYTNLIMLDDDCKINATQIQAQLYLNQIEENIDCFIEFNSTLLKLFCISRELFSQVDFDDVNPEDEGGFEDTIFVNKLRNLFPEKQRTFNKNGMSEYSVSTKDPLSTWYKNQDITKMLNNTEKICAKLYELKKNEEIHEE